MGGFGSFISGAGAGAAPLGLQLHRQRFEAGQQSQRLGHMSKQELADRMSQNAEYYGGVGSPVGRQMHSDSAAVLALPDDGNLYANLAKYEAKHAANVQKGEALLAQNHAGMVPPVGTPPSAAAPTVQNSNPFARLIGPGAVEASPLPGAGAPPAAQPASNPLTSPAPSAPGGGGSAGNFPVPSAPGAPAPVPAVPASGADTAVPPVAPGALPNFQADIDEFNTTGYMSPVLRAIAPGQIGLNLSKQKLAMVEPYIAQLPPQLQSIVRAEILAGGSGMNGLMSTMFAAPQKEFIDATNMTPEQKSSMGLPPDATGKQTVLLDRFRNPVGAFPGWAGTVTTTNEQGVQGKQSVNDALAHGVIAVGGGPSVAPTTLAPVNTGLDSAGHNVYESKGKIIRDLAGGGTRTGAGINPAVLPTTGTEIRTVQTVDAQGRPVTEMVPVQVSHAKVMPGKTGKIPAVGGGVAGGQGPQTFLKPLTSTTQGMKEAAPKVLDLIDRVEGQITREQNELGPLAGRWSEFMAGKVGAPNPEFTELRTNVGLLQTLLMRMHVGARGGQQMMEHFQGLLDSGKQSPENLHAALREIRAYANDVLSEGPAQIVPRADIPPVSGASPNIVHWGRDAKGNPVRLNQ